MVSTASQTAALYERRKQLVPNALGILIHPVSAPQKVQL